jgi:hypothetical protein
MASSGGLSRALFLSYDTARYPFHALAAEVLGASALANLHDHVRAAKKVHTLRYEDNLAQRATLAAMPEDGPFYRLYRQFIAEEVAPRFGGQIGFTAHPTFRVHMAHTGCVSKWHADAEVTGEPMYIAVWLPFVDVAGTNTLWVESDYGLGDYGPVPVAHGEAFVFDGSHLKHGTVANETDVTRVSMDFRFLVRPRPGVPLVDHGVFAGRPPGLDQSAAPARSEANVPFRKTTGGACALPR